MMETIAGWLGNLSEFAVYAAIALVTLAGVIKCIYPLLRNASLLNRAVAALERKAAAGDHPAWREQRFLGRSLRAEWQRFLMNAVQLDRRGMPCDMSEYLNPETVIDKPGHAQLAELIPGLLTSLGILGTFMGLMQGLTSVNFANAEGTIRSIPELLSGMRFAFATSVAGISCSLAFNMVNRMAAGRAGRALDAFEDAFYELAMPRPLQPEVRMLCQKQDEDARMARLMDGVSARVVAGLETAVGRAMQPFSQSMDAFIKGATQEQVEGVRRIAGQFVQQMNASLSGQMSVLGDTMHIVSQRQLETQQNLQNTLNTARALTDDARTIQRASGDIARHMRDLSAEMARRGEEREKAVEQAERAGGALAERLDALSGSLLRMQEAVDKLTAELDGQQDERG